jgi:Lrp/AsnC family transcriptional regulator, leucine-responsive regulatory protein
MARNDAPARPGVPLDELDRRILEELQRDGGLSNLELAERVGLSPSPCSRRVKALEDASVIARRVTVLDRKKLGLTLTAIIQIAMDRHTPERFASFEKKVKACPEVQACYLVAGQEADYLLKVVLPDMDHYQEFLLNKITRIEGVSGVRSSFVMREVIDTTELPLGYLSGELD